MQETPNGKAKRKIVLAFTGDDLKNGDLSYINGLMTLES
jgi:hypothetical protein